MYTTSLLRRRSSQLAVILPFFVAACSDSLAPPKAATIEVNSAVDAAGFTGVSVAVDPEVLVRDENGAPIAGVMVTFAVTAGGGSVATSTTISGPEGRATPGQWTLGSAPGTNTLVATLDRVGSVTFSVEAVPVPTGRFELMTIDGQPLPFGDEEWSLMAAVFTLSADATFAVSWEASVSGQEGLSRWETMGKLRPRAPTGLSFSVGSYFWGEGTIEGDVLTLKIDSKDENGFPVSITYVAVRAE